jgi:hypothetical protein
MSKFKLTLLIIFLFSGLACFAQTGEKSNGSQNDEKIIDSQVKPYVF